MRMKTKAGIVGELYVAELLSLDMSEFQQHMDVFAKSAETLSKIGHNDFLFLIKEPKFIERFVTFLFVSKFQLF